MVIAACGILTGCTPALVSYSAPVAPTTLSPADRAWIAAITNRVNDLVSCTDVQVRACIDATEAVRKEQ